MNSPCVRLAAIVTFFGIPACDSDLGAGDGSTPTAQRQSRLSSDWVKTILKDDGTLFSLYDAEQHFDGCGELGNGSYTSSSTPVQVVNLEGIVQISSKFDFNLALRDDGTVWFWGFRGKNESGESVCQNVPVQVAGIGEAVDIYAAPESLIETKTGEYFVFNVDDYSVEPVLVP